MIIALIQGAVARGADSAAALAQHADSVDTPVVESPLPAGVAAVFRWLFSNVPAWLQIAGAAVGAIVGIVVLFWIFSHRKALWAWFTSRTTMMRATLGVAAAAILVVAGVAGAATWNYTQHSNDFCVSCHVMTPAFQKFARAGNKHSEQSCHSCHQQSIFDSMWQVYWWVAERPEDIRKHAKVPNERCVTCHVTADTAVWQRVAATAGHRVHLESDSAPLKNLQCVTCHGVEVHAFKPVGQTCGQTDCHKAKDTDIILGKMTTQTVRHCTSCHNFVADVPALATTDSARGSLVPGKSECLGCHEMQQVLKDFEERKDPHGGKCGTCHNAHTQKTPAEAKASCAKSGCHDNWKDTPFHAGVRHKTVAEKCVTCHEPHKSKVDASGCQECHARVRAQGARRPPLAFDTTQALRRMNNPPASHPYEEPEYDSPTDGSDAESAPASDAFTDTPRRSEAPPPTSNSRVQATRAAADSFPHTRHTKIACLVCHGTGDARHGRLTFERPRGCQICHHQDASPAKCVTCHRPEKYGTARQASMTVTVPGRSPKPRAVEFLHSRHATGSCVECHTTPVTLAAAPAKAACTDCHGKHGVESPNCTACHRVADPKVEHKPIDVTHEQCDACHTPAIVKTLTPTRNLCATCHVPKAANHYDTKECSTCHFLAAPSVYRAKLTKPPAR